MFCKLTRFCRIIASVLLVIFTIEIFSPAAAYALTGGPGQPEFSSFEPVNSSNMVNEFTGDFTYNLPVLQVPGPHGSGYSLSLSYHSGASPEEEASWVGYGWTLNPGAVNRNVRGLPDDYKGDVTYWNKMPRNWTVSVGANTGLEAFSKDKIAKGLGININRQLRYNNYTGFGYSAGIGLSHKIGVSLGLNVSDGNRSFSGSINPAAMLDYFGQLGPSSDQNSTKKENQKFFYKQQLVNAGDFSLAGSKNSLFTYAESVRPTQIQELQGNSYTVTFGTEINPGPIPAGVTVNVNGSYSYQESKFRAGNNRTAYGFMYTGEKTGNNTVTTDYYVEKETPFQKRDTHLGVPFNNADNFMVTGEGIGGGFRMYHKKTGEFTPNTVQNTSGVFVAGGEVNAGFAFGAGVDKIGTGKQSLDVSGWRSPLSFSKEGEAQVDEPVFFRFNNDLGGDWNNSEDSPAHVRLQNAVGGGYAPANVDPALLTEEQRSGRSSYIGFNINKSILNSANGLNTHRAYNKRADIEALTNRSSAGDAIGEFAITNENGNRYLYGLPLYNKNEASLSYGVQGVSAANIQNNYLAYSDKEETKVGQEVKGKPFANTFLLSEITTPDYIDRTLNGPTSDDLGGYTVFGYEKLYGFGSTNGDNWYRWRVPYNGLLYQRNSLSDNLDDMASVTEGEKEIAYLKYIKTKTHVAFFILGDRTDGLEASSVARTNPAAKGTKTLKRLDRIDLYLLSDLESGGNGVLFNTDGTPKIKSGRKPIKTTHFKYDYTAWNGIPNSANNTGKLTLTRVWFEYNGVVTSRISPYEFKYTYPDHTTYPANYRSAMALGFTGLSQLPNYTPFSLDAWGSYQSDGAVRFANLQTWLDQTPDKTTFDPAAWQLKRIVLPSGGEIHVQYEQDDYTHVQDQPAHVMARLKSATANGGKLTSFTLDLIDVGAFPGEVLKWLNHYYVNGPEGRKKISFKFLYTLMGNNAPVFNNCNVDYISGYADIQAVRLTPDGADVVIELKNEGYSLPDQVCRDFVLTQRAGRINNSGSCNPSLAGIQEKTDAKQTVKQLVNMMKANLFPGTTCQQISYPLSYFKIPFPADKKGGGIRVKRLLTFDRGFDGQPVLYGSEYIYKAFDTTLNKWRSSGVATNEPASIREENALVTYLPRKKQSWASKIISGEDKQQAEGPLGESIMPGPSVGYSRILIKNIHSGKTNTGFVIKEFFTAKEYPVLVQSSELETKTQLKFMNGALVNVNDSKVWASQGFSFILNNMHGQLKRTATYSGTYTEANGLTNESLASEQVYEYFEPPKPIKPGLKAFKPAERVPIQSEYGGGVEYLNPGKETDITLSHKSVKDAFIDANVEFDVSIAPIVFWFVVFPTFMPSLTKSNTDLYTYATSKVIRYPTIVKKVRSYQDGVSQSVETLAFDKLSGQAVLTKTEDEIKGSYVSREAMGSWFYSTMGAKWENENKSVSITGTGLRLSSEGNRYYIYYSGSSPACAEVFNSFKAGDLVLFNDTFVGHVERPETAAARLAVYPATSVQQNNFPITGTETPLSSIRILRSGQTNQLSVKAGSTSYHYNILPDLTAATAKFSNAQVGTFEGDLNNALKSNTNVFELTGGTQGYSQVNLAYFGNKIPACPDGLRLFNVKFRKQVNSNGTVTLELVSFQVKCGSGALVTIE